MSLGISATSYSSLLSSVLMNKLPPEFQLIISQTVTEENWELDTLLESVEMEISARERSETVSVHHTPQNQRSVPTAIFMPDNSPSTNCVYCNESHTPSFCKSLTHLMLQRMYSNPQDVVLFVFGRVTLLLTVDQEEGVITAKANTMAVFVHKESP